MRIVLVAALMSLGAAFAAHAGEPLAPVQQQFFACGSHHRLISHVAFVNGANACCAHGSGCAEALSTTVLAKPAGRFRT